MTNTRRSARTSAATASDKIVVPAAPLVNSGPPKKTKTRQAKAVAPSSSTAPKKRKAIPAADTSNKSKKKRTEDDKKVDAVSTSTAAATPTVSTPVKKTKAARKAKTSKPPATPVTPNKGSDTLTPSTASAPTKVTGSVVSIVSPNPKAPAVAVKKSSNFPVDVDIAIVGKVHSHYEVVQINGIDAWYDVVLNQCNIGNNNNKYYRMQMLKDANSGNSGSYYVWFKWGRVGEAARSSASTWTGPFQSEDAAKSTFTKKYRDKTGNAFGATSFVEKTGKYVPVQLDNDVEVNEPSLLSVKQDVEVEYMASKLDSKTKELVEVLFSKEMRSEALTSFNLDLRRLPLGVPSKPQIEHGISILRRIEDKLNGVPAADGETLSYEELSSRFYTAIPHSFGRTRPPQISTKESLQSRYDMCNMLLDMYDTTETVKRIEAETKATTKKMAPNPIDQYYTSLKADLTLVDKASPEDKIIRQYFEATKGSHSSSRLLDVWSVNRQGESERFAAYDAIGNRRLLWHGTNIAVVAPIITTGLRIMPHSGGRVGAGIYLANLQQKSAQYTSGYGSKFACMFLCEAPLGKQHMVREDGPHASGLRTAPPGFDSVHAVGAYQPKSTTIMKIDNKDVVVPNSQAEPSGVSSSFAHDEFLVYNEKQVRLRYVVTVKL
jgi:poly [ADP-ribose] polymerase 2/3/4